MRLRPRWYPAALTATSLAAGLFLAASASAQDIQTVTEEGVISGTMTIDFKTRTTPDRSGQLVEGSPALGAQDKYSFELNVAKTTQFVGSVTRQPTLLSKLVKSVKQPSQLGFDISLWVLNPADPKQKKNVGKWVGTVPINTQTGAYELAGGQANQSALRVAVDTVGTQKAFTDNFSGRLVGKSKKEDNLAEYTYKRLMAGRTVEVVVKKVDPMKFENIVIAKGPAETYPKTVVNGRLDYDYETGNWLTDGIRFKYNLNGKDYEDIVTGSIKWIEDPNRSTNGKGVYEFNLRVNEEKNKPATSESDAFKNLSAEDAFFAVDNTIPCLTGSIDYVDTMVSGSDAPSSSKVTYKLNANKLNKQQIMNIFKLWLVCIGPTNDE